MSEQPQFIEVPIDGQHIQVAMEKEPLRSRLRIVPSEDGKDVLTIATPAPYPGSWRRFWYWALLGWKWERIDG